MKTRLTLLTLIVCLIILSPWIVFSLNNSCTPGHVKKEGMQKFVCVTKYVPCVERELANLSNHQTAERTAAKQEIEIICPQVNHD